MFKNMNTERASYFTERSYTTSEAENKKDIFEYWKKILGEDTLRVAEKCYGIDLVKVLNSKPPQNLFAISFLSLLSLSNKST